MARLIPAVLIGLMGAAALVMSAIQPWYGDRDPKDVPLLDLVPGADGSSGGIIASMVVPLVAAAGVVVLALVLRSKIVMAAAGLLGLVTAALWFAQLDRGTGSASGLSDFDPGLWSASAALFLVAVAAAVLPRPAAR